ncbi:MAG: hypothetical protein ABEJ31_15040 [Haloarculaceae archaeon]
MSNQEPFFMNDINKLFGDWGKWNNQRLGIASMALGALVGMILVVPNLPAVASLGDVFYQVLLIVILTIVVGFVGAVIDELL